MPKVVSFKPQVFTNAGRNITDSFLTLNCKKCNTISYITDADLDEKTVPQRKTDKATVLNPIKNTVKLCCTPSSTSVEICRLRGIEVQWQHHCSQCTARVGYQCADPIEGVPKFIYVDTAAVTWPKIRGKTPWVCKTCGYVCHDKRKLDDHLRERGHEAATAGEAADPDGPVAPLIVG
eukprot:GHVR01082144.1.p1 GENE.GHVR01082144.1~~GHVR01082144.1.p1  ORF type:complete len:178 (+),score=38.38 GHVR01082144.1:166-699(+)